MHLYKTGTCTAMPAKSGLPASEGALVLAFRHGLISDVRLMSEVPSGETIELAAACGLVCVLSIEARGNRELESTCAQVEVGSPTQGSDCLEDVLAFGS